MAGPDQQLVRDRRRAEVNKLERVRRLGRCRSRPARYGGEKTLRALAAEAAASEARYQARVRTVPRSSYSAHWRRMLSPLLKALEVTCNNTAYRPVKDAIDLLERYLEQPLKEGAFFGPAETVPLQGWCPSSGGRPWWTTRAALPPRQIGGHCPRCSGHT
ncbi:hypothetical protein ACIHCQ_39375 [Streptomyces sp. NPDC052236]|uniref:hypothetical protein n=1 Tax=Streptomyces sp. NPDC052236 TaxID=3365686 RepID=UPI0037D4BC99